jgi:hypothetical protein
MSDYPSVTEILGTIHNSYGDVPAAILDRASDRGTRAHKANYAYAMARKFGLYFSRARFVQQDIEGYFQSFRLWFDEYVDEVFAAEEEFIHPVYRYRGHPDMVCRLRGESRPVVPDWKTPATMQKSWRLQMAGYLDLVRYERYQDADRAFALQLDPGGRMAKARAYRYQAEDIAVFRAAVGVYHYLKK